MHQRKVSVTGLGYVGLPIAMAFAKQAPVWAFDILEERVTQLKQGYDKTNEVPRTAFAEVQIHFTTEIAALAACDFHIVTVPTPIDNARNPDLSCLSAASHSIGSILKKGDIVVYESTVYPGLTEEVCIPILEQCSKMIAGKDFFVGYSPERINPGDPLHAFSDIKKVVAGQTPEVALTIAEVYQSVVKAGVYIAESIRVAEAAKVIENTQRDLNIALMNELAIICAKLNIDTLSVLKAARTKWNFLPFEPGLVGGHCIGVDPYYLTYKAQVLGYHPEVILAGRRINDGMGKYIAEQTIKSLIQLSVPIKGARIGILGVTFKENCPDLRNSRVVDVIAELQTYGVEVLVHDPLAIPEEAWHEYQVRLTPWAGLTQLDAIIVAVRHRHYCELSINEMKACFRGPGFIADVKGVINQEECAAQNISLWRL